jgi:DNA-binding transcriptional ArsR family regulator
VDKLSITFAALSDPTRRQIVGRLARGPATVNELTEPFSISQQAISKHVAYLEKANLLEKRREGREHICSLTPGAIRVVFDWAAGFQKLWEERYDRLDGILEEMKAAERKKGRKPHV